MNKPFFFRTLLLMAIAVVFCLNTQAQTPTGIYTSGKTIFGICGDTIVLRGVNYAPYNWGSDNSELLFSEVAKTGANTVRMTWYANSNLPAYTDALLDSAIGNCIRNKMIPVVELHNLTCDFTTSDVETLALWYTDVTHLAIINKYKSSLIIDIANEVGAVNWTGNPALAQQQYSAAYDSAVHILRNAGITVPLMIDAPDCGTSIDVLGNVAAGIIANDPLQNLIFSTHAYWVAYANNDSATMQQLITTALAADFPLVIGEVANYQDSSDNSNNTYYCHWPLNYSALLNICKQNNVGWLVWSWNNDQCASRQLSTDGMYTNLTTYGMDIVNNNYYGLHNSSRTTGYLANNGICNNPNGLENLNSSKTPFLIYNTEGVAYVRSESAEPLQITCFDMLGRLYLQTKLQPGQVMALPQINMGIVQVTGNGQGYIAKFINQ